MKRILPRYAYTSLVGVVIATMTVNPASAGWLLHKVRCRLHAHHAEPACPPVSACEPVCCEPVAEPTCCEPAPAPVESCCGSVVEAAPVESACCGGEVVHEGSMIEGEIIHDGSSVVHEGASPDSVPMDAPMIESHSQPMTSSEPTSPMDAADTPPAPAAEPKAQPEPAAAQPAAPTPAAEPAPATPAPVEAAPAAVEPAPAAPAVDPAPAAPADAPMDDLFGGDAPAEPAAPAAPAEPAAPAAADDLFGTPEAAPAAPAGADDLFGAPEAAAPAADAAAPAMDDIFGAPPAVEPAAPAAPADAAPPAETDSLDDLFSAKASLADRLAASEVRVWIDNTGKFSTEGRLIEIGSDYIRLAKTNGRTCTVPFDRLCAADADYVAAISRDTNGVKFAMTSAR